MEIELTDKMIAAACLVPLNPEDGRAGLVTEVIIAALEAGGYIVTEAKEPS